MPLVAFVAALTALAATASADDTALQEVRRPNILFVLADDHGRQAISAYGSYRNQTPNIDRLAREGMLLRHSLVTNSICGPSRAVILTGSNRRGGRGEGTVLA